MRQDFNQCLEWAEVTIGDKLHLQCVETVGQRDRRVLAEGIGWIYTNGDKLLLGFAVICLILFAILWVKLWRGDYD